MTYSYVHICRMLEHYEDLVKTARNEKELEVRLQGLYTWKIEWLKYNN